MLLTRSLLALAILAVANAQDEPCVTKCSGTITHSPLQLQQVIVSPPRGEVIVPIEACHNGDAVGECVTACNRDGAPAPSLDIDPSLTTVVVDCDNGACPSGVSVDITLYCQDEN